MGVRNKLARGNDKPLINEHDLTKMMLNKLNEGLITEEKNDSIVLDGPEKKEAETGFERIVGTLGNIKGYRDLIVYPYDDNVVWGGDFHNGLIWTFSLRDGVTFGGEVQVDDDYMELTEKLNKYGDEWANEWAKKLRDDYKTQSDERRG